jgi:two-component system, sensor histidine kinase PdtaS
MQIKPKNRFSKRNILIWHLAPLIVLSYIPISACSQSSVGNYKRPSEYQITSQRLLLQLSSTYYTVVKEGQVDLDNSLLYASHSLGMSRLPLIAEGIEDPQLMSNSKWVDKRTPREGVRMLSTSTGKQHLELLVLIGAYYAFQPDSYHSCKDSVLKYLNKAIAESKEYGDQKLGRVAMRLIGKMYVQAYEFKQGDAIFNRLIKQCQDTGDLTNEASAWDYRGIYTAYSPTVIADRITYLYKAVKLYHQLGNRAAECNALTNICYLNVASYKLEQAYKVSKQALEIAESIKFPYTHYNTDAIAMVGLFIGQFGEPLKYTIGSIRTAQLTRDSIGLPYFYSRLAVLYLAEGDREQEVITWGMKATNSFLAAKESSYLNLNNLVISLLHFGRTQETITLINRVIKLTPPITPTDKLLYYLTLNNYYSSPKIKRYDKAEACLLKADSIEKEIGKHGLSFRRGMITAGFADLYLHKGDYRQAKEFYERYLADPTNIEGLNIRLGVLRRLITIDALTGDQASELKHQRLQRTLTDSAFRVSKVRQAEELNVKYATEEKQNQITLLNKNAKLERANLQQANLTNKLTIGGILLVVIIAGLLYRQNRLKQKNNEVITHKNDLLQNLVSEKEWLLKEVHHRVKNNLHTVICLLESQSAYLEDDALKAIEESQHRIFTMSLIHQKLYQADDIKTIDMAVYIPELVQYLQDGFDISDQIRFNLTLDPIHLNASQAIPLALIINEALTNSIKYAFPDGRKGKIIISLTDTGQQIKLELSDNGVGIKKDKETSGHASLGMELIKGLTKEMMGEIAIEDKNGVRITLYFDHDILNNFELSQAKELTHI